MKILITNDDGIKAEGMLPFVRWAAGLGEVTVAAPKYEQSGKSHAIDIRNPIEVKEITLADNIRAFSVDSTPADCVRMAVLGMKEHYDLVFSGINRGYNMGGDIFYSGTMGAAKEAAYLGLKAVAFSTDVDYYINAAKDLDRVWDFFCRNKLLEEYSLYNVNIPPDASDIRITQQGGPYFSDGFDSVGNDKFKAHGICVYSKGNDLSLDTDCVMNGHISISPITIDVTEKNIFNKLKNLR